MSLKLNLTVPNKAIHALIAVIIVSALVTGAVAYANSGDVLNLAPPTTIPNPGHSSTQIMINLGVAVAGDPCTGDITLQQALEDGCFKISEPSIPACADNEILKFNATSGAWECNMPVTVPFIPSCAGDEILKFDATAGDWVCSTDESLGLVSCANEDYLRFDTIAGDWVCDSGGSPCIANPACAATTCVGDTCTDSCGNVYNGLSSSGSCCVDTSWTPATSTFCSGTNFTQTSNCGRTRVAVGTKSCCTTYTDSFNCAFGNYGEVTCPPGYYVNSYSCAQTSYHYPPAVCNIWSSDWFNRNAGCSCLMSSGTGTCRVSVECCQS